VNSDVASRVRTWKARLWGQRPADTNGSAKPVVVIHEKNGRELHEPSDFFDEPFKTSARELKWIFHRGDLHNDGLLVGKRGKTYSAHMPLAAIPSVSPRSGPAPVTAIYVNGINTPLERQVESFQELADTLGVNIIGVHNSTVNVAEDVRRIANEELNNQARPATATVAEQIESSLEQGKPIHLIAHSGGGVTVSEAIFRVQARLRERGASEAALKTQMALIFVTTFGATGFEYPDGPRYEHWINALDFVPTQTGIGVNGQMLLPDPRPGEGARVHRFTTAPLEDPHGIETYLRYYRLRS
jgi:hypothetical protein